MMYSIDIRNNDGTDTRYACNGDKEGVFKLVDGAYRQLTGTCQTPTFRDRRHFRQWISRHFGVRGRMIPAGEWNY